jgi:hypothetical protein
MDVAGDGTRQLGPHLAAYRELWLRGAGQSAEPRAHDFVIPTASQLLPEGSETFLGNLGNRDASHLSGARLETRPTDLELTCRLLRKMTAR